MLLIGYILSETVARTLYEGFAVVRRTDIGPTTEGWTHDEAGYVRDIRYSEMFVDVQNNGVAGDFCRAIHKKGDPQSLRIACALATREGMDTLELQSPTLRQGFKFSRDDYWRDVTGDGRMDYCRILRSDESGRFIASCAVTTRDEIGSREIRDTNPPPAIRLLLEAYEDILVWYRFQDDAVDYAGNTALEYHGRPEVSSLIRPLKTRGVQFNREGPMKDYFAWGERDTLHLDQDVPPTQIRAISFWVWMDTFDSESNKIMECKNYTKDGNPKDLVWIGVDRIGPDIPAICTTQCAAELSPSQSLCYQNQVEPVMIIPQIRPDSASWVFEIWDEEQRIMHLEARHSAKKAQWQHVVFTTADSTSWWPTWEIWIDGEKVAEKKDGRSIPALLLSENTLGKFRGCLQDFRVYRSALTPDKMKAAIAWGKSKLHPNP